MKWKSFSLREIISAVILLVGLFLFFCGLEERNLAAYFFGQGLLFIAVHLASPRIASLFNRDQKIFLTLAMGLLTLASSLRFSTLIFGKGGLGGWELALAFSHPELIWIENLSFFTVIGCYLLKEKKENQNAAE